MNTLRIRLFGKFQAELEGRPLNNLDAFKVQELFCYLLLNRDRPHHRESLSGLLWGDSETSQSKKYLRQALWQLQLALNSSAEKQHNGPLVVDPDWVSIVPRLDFWLDVQVFDETLARVHGIPGQALELAQVQALKEAIQLYRGDLLEGCYQEWCLYERERLQSAYLDMLDKLMAYAVVHGEYEDGLEYGARILRHDRARERTHWQLMRLYYLAGDRAGALRQYERCALALDQELGVKPSRRTIALYEQIRADSMADPAVPNRINSEPLLNSSSLLLIWERLQVMSDTLNILQDQVNLELRAVEDLLNKAH